MFFLSGTALHTHVFEQLRPWLVIVEQDKIKGRPVKPVGGSVDTPIPYQIKGHQSAIDVLGRFQQLVGPGRNQSIEAQTKQLEAIQKLIHDLPKDQQLTSEQIAQFKAELTPKDTRQP